VVAGGVPRGEAPRDPKEVVDRAAPGRHNGRQHQDGPATEGGPREAGPEIMDEMAGGRWKMYHDGLPAR